MSRDHVASNLAYWSVEAADYVAAGRRAWSSPEPIWGIFEVPDARLGLFPDVTGLDVVELGCGAGYVSAWAARRGARRVVGLDLTPEQLASARSFQSEFGLSYPLVRGDAEQVPMREASFDVALSEYGAAMWCDPERWLAEAARLLRPGGRLVMMNSSPLLCAVTGPDDPEDEPVGTELRRDWFDMRRFDDPDGTTVFCLPHGEMIRVLRACGFEVERLVEVQPPAGASTRYPFVTAAWARRWPCEEAWVARRV